LAALKQHDCWPNDTLVAWQASGAHKSDIVWKLSEMQKPGPDVVAEVQGKLERKEGKDLKELPTGSKRNLNAMLSPESVAQDQAGEGGPLMEILQGDDVEMEVPNSDDENLLGSGGSQAKKPMECQSFAELDHELKKSGVLRTGDETLNSRKLAQLGELVPASLVSTPPLKKAERLHMLKEYPLFNNILPKALDKDLTNLSSSLSRMEKNHIKFLYRCQLRLREKMRVVLANMYDLLEDQKPINRQSPMFDSWSELLALLNDDYSWLVREQQVIILAKHGVPAEALATDSSIIPLEIKGQLKDYMDFQRSVLLSRRNRTPFFSYSGNLETEGGFPVILPPQEPGDRDNSIPHGEAPQVPGKPVTAGVVCRRPPTWRVLIFLNDQCVQLGLVAGLAAASDKHDGQVSRRGGGFFPILPGNGLPPWRGNSSSKNGKPSAQCGTHQYYSKDTRYPFSNRRDNGSYFQISSARQSSHL